MMKRKIFTICAFIVFATPFATFAESIPAGIQGKLWFSKDPFFAGDTITVFALIYNSSEHRLSGMIALNDGTTTASKKPFEIDALGGSRIVSFPLFVKEGSHTFSATLFDVVLVDKDNSTTVIDPMLSQSKTAIDARVVLFENKPSVEETQNDSLGIPAVIDATKQLATTSAHVVDQVSTRITESAPVSVASRAIPVIGSIDAYRKDQAEASYRKIVAITDSLPKSAEYVGTSSQEIVSNDSSQKISGWRYFSSGLSDGSLFKTPFRYVELFFVLLWNFLTEHVIVFYLFVLLAIFKLIRMILGLLF